MKRILLLTLTLYCSLTFAQYSCEEAIPVEIGTYVYPEITSGDLPDVACIYDNENTRHAVWYKFSPSEDGRITINTDLEENTNGDTRIRVYTNTCNELQCVTGHDDLNGDNEFGVYLSRVTFNTTAGQDYYIVFDDKWRSNSYTFEITEEANITTLFTPQSITNYQNESCAVDMNGDFLDDIVTVNSNSNTVFIHYQQENGGFTSESFNINFQYSPSWSITAGDLNGDLKNDLLFGNGSGSSFLLSNPTNNTYDLEESNFYIFSQRTNFVDINNDGYLDAFICHDVQPNVYVLNTENTSYEWFQGGLGDFPNGGNYGSIWVDYDNDGDQDLYIAKCRGSESDAKINELHRNNGDGTFTDVSAESNLQDPIQTWSAAWGDFDNDGDFDAYVGVSYFYDGGHKLMVNNGDGTFENMTEGTVFENFEGSGRENVAFDFDNNGYIDILSDANGGTIFFNYGDFNFEEVYVNINGGAVADLNNDGFLDIHYFNNIYYNNGNDNNWLKINTVGTESNTNGIGARIEVTTAQGTQIREVRSGEGFSHGHSLNAHFGLGTATTIDRVVIKWPSGIVDTYNDVDINQALFALEGETLSTQNVSDNKNEISISPNPAKDFVVIKSNKSLEPTATLYNSSGQMIKKVITDNTINLKGLPTGVYFIKLIDIEGNVSAKKIIIK